MDIPLKKATCGAGLFTGDIYMVIPLQVVLKINSQIPCSVDFGQRYTMDVYCVSFLEAFLLFVMCMTWHFCG